MKSTVLLILAIAALPARAHDADEEKAAEAAALLPCAGDIAAAKVKPELKIILAENDTDVVPATLMRDALAGKVVLALHEIRGRTPAELRGNADNARVHVAADGTIHGLQRLARAAHFLADYARTRTELEKVMAGAQGARLKDLERQRDAVADMRISERDDLVASFGVSAFLRSAFREMGRPLATPAAESVAMALDSLAKVADQPKAWRERLAALAKEAYWKDEAAWIAVVGAHAAAAGKIASAKLDLKTYFATLADPTDATQAAGAFRREIVEKNGARPFALRVGELYCDALKNGVASVQVWAHSLFFQGLLDRFEPFVARKLPLVARQQGRDARYQD